MLPLVFPLLSAASAVTALIGTAPVRAYRHDNAPQNVATPYVTWFVPGGAAANSFDGAAADFFRVQIDCWSDGDAEVEALASAVRAAIEPAAHLQAYVANGRDPATHTYRIGMTFDFIVPR